jgi:hypothetical protein
VAVAAPKTAPTASLRDGWHGPAGQNRACGAVWIALSAVLAIVVAPCFSDPSVETVCLGIACLYSGRSSIRLGVEQLRAGRRVSVDGKTTPGTRLIAGDEIERFAVGSDSEHERLAPAFREHERLAPARIVVVARRGR